MSDPNPQEPLSMLSESSFVILGQGSLPSLVNDDLNKNPNLDSFSKTKSPFNTYNSTDSSDKFYSKLWSGSSISEEEIRRKLDELIRENSQLKETLNQNNLAIKSQLDTFIMWQQEVLKTHETHKQKFLETKDLILKLRAENMSLKRHMEEFSPGIPTGNGDGNGVYSQVQEKPEDLHKLKQKIKECEQICNDLNVKNDNLDAENQRLKEELRISKTEVLKLNKELEDVGRENMFLKQRNESVSKNSVENMLCKSLPSSEARAQISNLIDQLDLEKDKVVKLTKELEKTKSNDSGTKLNTTDTLSHYINKLNNMNDSLDKQSQRYSSLSSWVALAEQNLKESKISEGVETNLVCEIKQLKSHLNQEENFFREKQESLLELKNQFHNLLEDYKSLQVKLTSLSTTDSNNENHNEVTGLLRQLDEKNQELILKQQECDELKATIKELNLKCEEVELLKVQVQLYQSDFNDEQAAREKLVDEKKEMAEQIQLLQNKIKTLEADSNNDNSVTSPLAAPSKKTKYVCPRCLDSFTSLSICELHIEECLDNGFL